MQLRYLLCPLAWEIHTKTYVAPSAPGSSGRLQRVDPFTVAPVWPAPESVTPSVDLRRFPANFISKLLIQLYRVRIQIARRFFLFSCIYAKKIGRKNWFIRNAYKRKQVYENIGRRIKLSNSEKNIKSVKMSWCFGNFERN